MYFDKNVDGIDVSMHCFSWCYGHPCAVISRVPV